MKSVVIKTELGGQWTLKNIMDEKTYRGTTYYKTANTDAGYFTITAVDAETGVFSSRWNTQNPVF